MKIILIIVICIVAAIFIIKLFKKKRLRRELLESKNSSAVNLDTYIQNIENKIVTSSDIDILTGLIHRYLCYDWLYSNHIRGSYKGAVRMLKVSQMEQARMINELKRYFRGSIGDQRKSLSELCIEKDKGLKLGSQKMNTIFESL